MTTVINNQFSIADTDTGEKLVVAELKQAQEKLNSVIESCAKLNIEVDYDVCKFSTIGAQVERKAFTFTAKKVLT